jgi:uncharacterized protein (TIGR00661 family)
MRFLFIVQGEGRGHMTQAIVLSSMLRNNGHEVVEVLIGKSPHREIPSYFANKIGAPVLSFDSPNFSPAGKNQKISITKTLICNFKKSPLFLNSFHFLEERIRFHHPDTVINFYDLIAGMLFEVKRFKVKFICIAHQYFFLHPNFKFPIRKTSEIAGFLYYTWMTCRKADKILALSLGTQPHQNSSKITIVPPLIREEIFTLEAITEDFILGYMADPVFESQVIQWNERNPEQSLHFFSDRKQDLATEVVKHNLRFSKINDENFIRQLAKCKGYATTAGFESICEAMYLGKPVLMVPAHIEQYCNMIDAERAGAGIGVAGFKLSGLIDYIPQYQQNQQFRDWVKRAENKMMEHLTE